MTFTNILSLDTCVTIKSLNSGDIFRLGHVSLPDAFASEAFYMKTHNARDPGSCVHLGNGETMAFQPASLVYKHTATLNIDS